MSDFPSLSDLTNKKDDSVSAGTGSLSVSSSGTQEKFEKKMGKISEKEKEMEAMRFAAGLGLPHINLDRFPVSQQALRQITKDEAEKLGVVCFFISQDEMRFGAVDPTQPGIAEYVKDMETRFHVNTGLYVISQNSFDRVIGLYATLPVVKPISKNVEITAESLAKVQADVTDFRSLQALLERASTTEILTFLLGASLKVDASDVHVETEESQIVVRFRLDGILHDAATIPKEAYKQLVSRVKLLSALKINVTATPQDGRFSIQTPDGTVDVRVSTLPTVHGESIVLRLLKQGREGISLESLGLRPAALAILQQEIARPNGMIITTGPTGSGKTTTLYAVLQMLNKPGVKIITLEDPVEYRIEGVNQSQIDHSKKFTFAQGLRSILRQDPDIAMVGEIRDLETAEIAIQAALTGHLMLSTLHTNSAAGAIPRFLSMGVKPFLLAPALNCLIGQRLVRKICDSCKTQTPLTVEQEERVTKILAELPASEKELATSRAHVFYTAPGCEVCHGIGYSGRVGIYEIMVVGSEIEQLILTGQVSEYDIEQYAVSHGMTTMVQDGILKALDGVTSVEEVLRVIE